MKVSDDTVSEFKRSGVTVIREAFGDWVETLRKGVDLNIRTPGADARTYVGKSGGGTFLSDFCNWQRLPEYRDFIFKSAAVCKTVAPARVLSIQTSSGVGPACVLGISPRWQTASACSRIG